MNQSIVLFHNYSAWMPGNFSQFDTWCNYQKQKKKKQPRQFGVTEYYKLINRETWSVAKRFFFQKGQRGMDGEVLVWQPWTQRSGSSSTLWWHTAGGSCVSIVPEINTLWSLQWADLVNHDGTRYSSLSTSWETEYLLFDCPHLLSLQERPGWMHRQVLNGRGESWPAPKSSLALAVLSLLQPPPSTAVMEESLSKASHFPVSSFSLVCSCSR